MTFSTILAEGLLDLSEKEKGISVSITSNIKYFHLQELDF
jgi:hypothetical protein